MHKKKTKFQAASVLLALGAVAAAPVARAAEPGTWTVAQAENPCGGRKRSSNPCGPSNPCGSRRQRRQSAD